MPLSAAIRAIRGKFRLNGPGWRGVALQRRGVLVDVTGGVPCAVDAFQAAGTSATVVPDGRGMRTSISVPARRPDLIVTAPPT